MIKKIKAKIDKIDKNRLFKFCVIGGSSAAINIGILALLKEVAGLHEMIAVVIAGTIVGIINYLGNHYWTFTDRTHGSHVTGGSKFFVLQTAYYAYYYGFFYILTFIVGVHYLVSSLLLIIIGFLLKYLVSTMWIWKHQDENTPSGE